MFWKVDGIQTLQVTTYLQYVIFWSRSFRETLMWIYPLLSSPAFHFLSSSGCEEAGEGDIWNFGETCNLILDRSEDRGVFITQKSNS